jgi:hypothetical protein
MGRKMIVFQILINCNLTTTEEFPLLNGHGNRLFDLKMAKSNKKTSGRNGSQRNRYSDINSNNIIESGKPVERKIPSRKKVESKEDLKARKEEFIGDKKNTSSYKNKISKKRDKIHRTGEYRHSDINPGNIIMMKGQTFPLTRSKGNASKKSSPNEKGKRNNIEEESPQKLSINVIQPTSRTSPCRVS